MSQVTDSKYLTPLVFSLDYNISKAEYQTFKQRIIDQLIQSVEVEGFRKGKVPEQLALKNLDPEKTSQTVAQETIVKFAPETFEQAKNLLIKDNRTSIDFNVTLNDPILGEQEDNSFTFRVLATLLPQIDIGPISKIKLVPITEADLPQRITREELFTREKANLLAGLNKENAAQYATLSEAFEKDENLQKQFKAEADFDTFLNRIFDQETEYLMSRARQQQLIKAIINDVPDFDINEDGINAEVTRIVTVVQKESEAAKISLEQAFKNTGLPNPDNQSAKSIVEVTGLINHYVKSEFKLMWLLRYIYETKSEPKLTSEELETTVRDIQREPERFGVSKDLSQEEYQNVAFDRSMRTRAIQEVARIVGVSL